MNTTSSVESYRIQLGTRTADAYVASELGVEFVLDGDDDDDDDCCIVVCELMVAVSSPSGSSRRSPCWPSSSIDTDWLSVVYGCECKWLQTTNKDV